MPFQTSVNTQPAVAVAGDFASANPRYSVLAGPGGLVAGVGGVTVGRFAWAGGTHDLDGMSQIVLNTGVGAPTGLVPRRQQGLLTAFLGESSMLIPQGFGLELMKGGDFFVKNEGATVAQPGQFAYANYSNGAVSFGAASAPATAVVTASVAASTGSFTGSIAGDVLTITAVSSGVLVVGGTISGTNVVSGSQIVQQLSGTAGGIGTYEVSIPNQTVASTTISETYGTMTVTAVSSGVLTVGGTITGTSVVAGTYISALGTGTGGTGTYIVSNNTVVTSTAVTEAVSVQTKFVAMSGGNVGDLIKISHLPNG